MTETTAKGFAKEGIFNQDRMLFFSFLAFACVLFGSAFLFNTPSEIFHGVIIILTSPANLVTDYFEIANIGAALANAAIMVVQATVIIKKGRQQISGLLVASVFMLAGFSLFGKNLYNSAPILLGMFAYAKFSKTPFSQLTPVALFSTALGPLVSEITFNFSLPVFKGVLLGLLAGFISGFFVPVLASILSFHKGSASIT